ncbi:CoA transferase [Hydrogenophaga sp.]|uniref:CaiB/BaiF CoA transferase family protein n=1 Tax=Hydrogenophaga sp. TaxID=1904254 RepID=UPI0026232AE7|nr:CoA transferase [Hydrogenophaga sp.]MCW5652185.1 CoA transferase [Hydrogenophaga sp.]
MNDRHSAAPGALDGIRVLDLSRFIAGPYCAMVLGDMGAEVLKIEKPGSGDPARGYQPQIGGRSAYSLMFNRNKKGVALDLRSEQGLATLRALIEKADVLVENFRPGTMEEMGLGWDAVHHLNPRLVMVRISGFGQDGPWAHLPAFDGIAQAMGGLMELNGPADGPPTVCGTYLCDYASGMYATMGTLAALRARDATGRGQVVDVALLDAASSFLMSALPEYHRLGHEMTRRGNRDRYSAPTNVYRARDGAWIYIVCGGADYFPRLLRAMGRPELQQDPRFATIQSRRDHWDDSEALVREWAATLDAENVVGLLREHDVPCGKVATIPEVANNPQLHHRGQIVRIDDPVCGEITMQGVTIRLSETPLTIRSPMPEVGQHTEEVLRAWLDTQPGETPVAQGVLA